MCCYSFLPINICFALKATTNFLAPVSPFSIKKLPNLQKNNWNEGKDTSVSWFICYNRMEMWHESFCQRGYNYSYIQNNYILPNISYKGVSINKLRIDISPLSYLIVVPVIIIRHAWNIRVTRQCITSLRPH